MTEIILPLLIKALAALVGIMIIGNALFRFRHGYPDPLAQRIMALKKLRMGGLLTLYNQGTDWSGKEKGWVNSILRKIPSGPTPRDIGRLCSKGTSSFQRLLWRNWNQWPTNPGDPEEDVGWIGCTLKPGNPMKRELRDKIDGKRLAKKLIAFRNMLETVELFTETISTSTVIEWMDRVFDLYVWRVIDQVYETRHDCCTAGHKAPGSDHRVNQ